VRPGLGWGRGNCRRRSARLRGRSRPAGDTAAWSRRPGLERLRRQ
jgi:hypothetical protein